MQGLAWSLVALARTGTAPAVLAEARSLLLDAQLANGAWAWNAAFPDANLQATAEAMQALSLAVGGRVSVRRATHRAANWLISEQGPGGGWLYTADQESPFLDAEIGLALFLAETSVGAHDGLTADGAVSTARPLTAAPSTPIMGPPLAQPLAL